MRIVCVADLHGRVDRIDIAEGDIARADLILLSGDITNFGRSTEANTMLDVVMGYGVEVLAVPGNCDYPEVEAVLDERGINLDGRGKQIDGITFIGLGGSLPGPGSTPNEYSEAQLAERLQRASRDLDLELPSVLLSHQPPRDTVADRVRPGVNVGSRSVRRFVEANGPLVCFTGHIHEGIGVDRIGSTQIVNPGPLGDSRYAYVEIDGSVKVLEIRGVTSPAP
jgi:Icc-related predicted phosphoesterase